MRYLYCPQCDVNRFFVQHAMISVCKILKELYLMEVEKVEPSKPENPQLEIQEYKIM